MSSDAEFVAEHPEVPELFVLAWRHCEKKFGVIEPWAFVDILNELAKAALHYATSIDIQRADENIIPIGKHRKR
jgi:hypothetical protein